MNKQQPAVLRTCASCEWIFRKGVTCPKCGFGSYGAHYVYGSKAYRYEKTQKPWYDRAMTAYSWKLRKQIPTHKPVQCIPTVDYS